MPRHAIHRSTFAAIRVAGFRSTMGFLFMASVQIAVAVNPIAPATYEQPTSPVDPAAGHVAARPDSAVRSGPNDEPLPISLRRPGSDSASANAGRGGGGSWITVAGSLSLVLALFFAVAWVTRRRAPSRLQALPTDVFDVLGRVPLGPRQNAQLVRIGSKLLLVAVSEGDATTLTEITEPTEVERLTELCQREVTRPPRGPLALGLGRFGRNRTETPSLQVVATGDGSSLDSSETTHRDLGGRRHA